MRKDIKEAVRDTVQDILDSGIQTSFTEKRTPHSRLQNKQGNHRAQIIAGKKVTYRYTLRSITP
jgi:hypothetical protein